MSAVQGAVPAFWLEAGPSRRIPVVVSLYLVNDRGVARLPPAVERALDRTVEITGRQGLAIADVLDTHGAIPRVIRSLERAIVIPGVVLLFRCQSVSGSERLMNVLNSEYSLSVLREA